MSYTVLSKLLSQYPIDGTDAFANYHPHIQTALKELRSFDDPFFVNLDNWGTFLTDLPFMEGESGVILGFIADFVDTLRTPWEHELISEVEASLTDDSTSEPVSDEELEEYMLDQAEKAMQEEGFDVTEVDPEDIISAVTVDPTPSVEPSKRFSPLLLHAPEHPNIVNKVSERRKMFKEGEVSPPPIYGFTKSAPLERILDSEEVIDPLFKTSALQKRFEITSSPGVRSSTVVEAPKPKFRLTPTLTRSTVELRKSDLLELLQQMIEEEILRVSIPTIVSSDNSKDSAQVDYNFDITDLRENGDGTLSLDFEMKSTPVKRTPTDVRELSTLWEDAPDVSTEFNTTPPELPTFEAFGEDVVDPRHNMSSEELERLWVSNPDLSEIFDSEKH